MNLLPEPQNQVDFPAVLNSAHQGLGVTEGSPGRPALGVFSA